MNTKFRRFLPGIALAILLTASYSASAFYDPSTGRWVSRDPIGERGGVNLYEFVNNNSLSWFDSFGLCCGSFVIREKPHIKVPDSQLGASGGKEYLDGFQVQYTPCDPCSCPADKIRLVQAIKSNGGTGAGPQFDSSPDQRRGNISGGDTSLPSYTDWGMSGDYGPLSYIDAPNNPRKLYGETTFSIEVCAVCKNGKDQVLGCTTFTFGDVKRKPVVPGGTARPNGDGVQTGCQDPGSLWNDALKQWNEMRNGK